MAQRPDTRSEPEKSPGNGGSTGGSNGEVKLNGEAKIDAVSAAAQLIAPWRSYKEQVAAIAQRIVEAQRPIRVLQALRWEPSVEEAFRRSRGRELPRVGPEEYAKIDLGFEPKAKLDEFEAIAQAAENELGTK